MYVNIPLSQGDVVFQGIGVVAKIVCLDFSAELSVAFIGESIDKSVLDGNLLDELGVKVALDTVFADILFKLGMKTAVTI